MGRHWNNIYGVDLNQESVEITKLSLWLKTAHKGEKLVTLKDNIKCGNSLIDDEAIAGIKAFDWQKEFPEILKNGGFDCVMGNPPWGANIDKESEWLGDRYPNSTKSYKDTYKIFVDKSYELLRGKLGLIVPNSFLYQPRHASFLEWLNENFSYKIADLGEHIFEDVDMPCCIFLSEKESNAREHIEVDLKSIPREELPIQLSTLVFNNERVISSKKYDLSLDDVLIIKDAGIQYHRTGVGMAEKGNSDLVDRIYSDVEHGDFTIPVYTGSSLTKNGYIVDKMNVKFFNRNYKNVLNKSEVVTFNKTFFDAQEKIVWRQTADRIIAAILGEGYFANTLQCAVLKDEYLGSLNINCILGILNSDYFKFLYQRKVREAGRIFPQVKLTYIKPLPFVIPDKKPQERIASYSLSFTKLYGALHEIICKFHQVLKAEYGLEKIPRKLEKFWELEGEQFLTVLKLKNVSLQKKQDLLEYFTKNKTECSVIARQIKEAQQALNEEVFDLYKLTPEERATVLQGT